MESFDSFSRFETNNNLRIFQREIYDFPSYFPVQNLAFDFLLSFFHSNMEFFDSFYRFETNNV